jgi:AcrR family transcriptional regulator
MGRKSVSKKRKPVTYKVTLWMRDLLTCLQQEDLEQITIDDMARLAGKSKSTIYEYFESKEDVLMVACQTWTRIVSERILKKSQQNLNTLKLYEELVEIFAEGNAKISLSFLQSLKQHYPKAWSVIEEFTDAFVDLLKMQYKQGIEEGVFNPLSVELLGQMDKIFVTQVVTDPAFFTDKEYTMSNLIRDYLTLRLTGLLKR